MFMKVAIPIWEDRVSPVLDTASRLLIVEVEGQKEASRFETYLADLELSHRYLRISGLRIDTLICGAVSRPFLMRLDAAGMEIITGVTGNPEDVLEAYLTGNLSDSRFLMPGFKKIEY
jgi:predicted Fe-Mo cluster-binding NifX family protein